MRVEAQPPASVLFGVGTFVEDEDAGEPEPELDARCARGMMMQPLGELDARDVAQSLAAVLVDDVLEGVLLSIAGERQTRWDSALRFDEENEPAPLEALLAQLQRPGFYSQNAALVDMFAEVVRKTKGDAHLQALVREEWQKRCADDVAGSSPLERSPAE